MAMLTSEEHPGPNDLNDPASLEVPRVFHTQSAVIGPPGHDTSVKTCPESSCLVAAFFGS